MAVGGGPSGRAISGLAGAYLSPSPVRGAASGGNGWGESLAGTGGTGGGAPFGVPPCRPPGARNKYTAPVKVQRGKKRDG